ncbi:MAG: hypothetical protein SFW66_03630 [Gammaproteobacteria bacterium]|nr:hypothetical protein [Gammaproteobacteria bacterium]
MAQDKITKDSVQLLKLFTLAAMTHNISALEKIYTHIDEPVNKITLKKNGLTQLLGKIVQSDINLYTIFSNEMSHPQNIPTQKGKMR